ncbi:pyruvate,orthophosphate dikinase [Palleronia aestuarii]|uniref:Pyruvate, phosphate dikinase n=1 Tax=Palleronia aestuarii TaxID=568105 RepID=A0A2W7N673_9RHOB|nr:putative PEP-binding protein [Palleronia aestuarii]PZX15213.1 pyruvate,orthophosphate dikinase [Palleronia aestuarii]
MNDAASQKHFIAVAGVTRIAPVANIRVNAHGGRAKCLQRLIRLGLPVPQTEALDFATVARIADGGSIDTRGILAQFPAGALVSVRPSSGAADWGGPATILNVGMNDDRHADLVAQIGAEGADALYARFIRAYATHVAGLDPDRIGTGDISTLLRNFELAAGEGFPQDPAEQLARVLGAMARAWNRPTARLLRQARNAPDDAGLGLVVQQMALGVGDPGQAESGSGVIQFVSPVDGQPQITGRYLRQSQGREALLADVPALYLTRDPRGPSLEALCPDLFAQLQDYGALCRQRLREEMQIEFTIEHGALHVLDAVRVKRSARAAVQIAVALAADGTIPEAEAVLRVEPRALLDLLHPQVDAKAATPVIGEGIAASPGAATGRLVFDAAVAQRSASDGIPAILVRRETTSGDVQGMHASVGILTGRGGVSSHAAVIARGFGLPCVVGVTDLAIDPEARTLTARDGVCLREGDLVTLDGSTGRVMAGAAPLIEPALDGAFRTLLDWADERRDIGIRANCDTPAEAAIADRFLAEGIGLCRTEHMFFDADRLTVMRKMILAERPGDRLAALERLLPMQRADFTELFRIMAGRPVCIRLLDPPLHEFLPEDPDEIRALAEALAMPASAVERRIAALREINPMLGLRGVRLGIAMPEIYDMQARAIFEAAVDVAPRVTPEVMIPLVSARREVELVSARIDAVAAQVRIETGIAFEYRLGVMVETPRAALRADEIAEYAGFLSFGTNDLTQMTYGLSRDDASRFMPDYVRQGVFPEDPFLRLDLDGVGELLTIGAQRGRAGRADITLSICGEHGGDPEAIAFCRSSGFDYISCSPFRVPVARLAAAHLAIREAGATGTAPPER